MTRSADDPVSELAVGLVPDLANQMRTFGERVRQALFEDLPEESSPAQMEEAALEGMIFFLSLLDRIALGRFGPFKRRAFMDAVLESISEVSPPSGLRMDAFRELWNARQRDYSSFKKLWPGEGESKKGTLCWEFAKRVGFQYGNGNPARLALIEAAGILTIETFCEAFSRVEI